MSLPTLIKTWQFAVNQLQAASGVVATDSRTVAKLIKDSLTGFATLPWAMRYSCNSTTAGTAGDGVDRLTTVASFVGAAAGSVHSWYVIRNTSLGANVELCFDFTSVGVNSCGLFISYGAGFTGGSTTARPTATDEQVIATTFTYHSTNAGSTRVHVLHATDGTASRLVVTDAVGIWAFLSISIPANAAAGWTAPVEAMAVIGTGSTASQLTAAQWASAIGAGAFRANSTNGIMSYACEGIASGPLTNVNALSVANEIDGNWPMLPLSIVGITPGLRGRHGSLVDMWAGPNGVPTGDTYPTGTSYQFAQFGQIILPWNGTVPVLN